jgi:hypothetical protein
MGQIQHRVDFSRPHCGGILTGAITKAGDLSSTARNRYAPAISEFHKKRRIINTALLDPVKLKVISYE